MRIGGDLMSKPINIKQLNNILNKYITDKIPFDEITVEKPQVNKSDPKLLKIFINDVKESLNTMRFSASSKDLKLFTVNAHALCSLMANIGESEKSAFAGDFEIAGQNNDREFIADNMESFVVMMEEFIVSLVQEDVKSITDDEQFTDLEFLNERLIKIKSACQVFDDVAIYEALNQLKEKNWEPDIKAFIENVYDTLYLYSDFDEVMKKIKGYETGN